MMLSFSLKKFRIRVGMLLSQNARIHSGYFVTNLTICGFATKKGAKRGVEEQVTGH
jgi:hypothetical protein